MGRGMVERLRFGSRAEPNESPQGGRSPAWPFLHYVLIAALLSVATYWLTSTWLAQAKATHVLAGAVTAGLLFGIGTFSIQWRRNWRTAKRADPSSCHERRLVLDERGLSLCAAGQPPSLLFPLGNPFGVVLLSNRARDRLVLALTSRDRTLYVGSALTAAETRAHTFLVSWASTVAEDDIVLDATSCDGTPMTVPATALEAMLHALLRLDGRALDRCFLSDASGAPVELDGRELRVGNKTFDLSAPLEWSALVFEEPIGRLVGADDWDETRRMNAVAVIVYQATWVRQGSNEVALVAPMASLTPNPVTADRSLWDHTPAVRSALLRDLRLMQASPAAPPARELRSAIDRVYMVRLRAALDQAPRTAQCGVREALRCRP